MKGQGLYYSSGSKKILRNLSEIIRSKKGPTLIFIGLRDRVDWAWLNLDIHGQDIFDGSENRREPRNLMGLVRDSLESL